MSTTGLCFTLENRPPLTLFTLPCPQIAIMNELIQAYLAAEDTLIQDRAAYAIQESIKFMKLGAKSPGFSADAQEVS